MVDGVTYCHSHIYPIGNSSNPDSLPNHSKEQLKMIQDYNHFTWDSVIVLSELSNPLYTLLTVFSTPSTTQISTLDVLYYSLRAPPFILV